MMSLSWSTLVIPAQGTIPPPRPLTAVSAASNSATVFGALVTPALVSSSVLLIRPIPANVHGSPYCTPPDCPRARAAGA